MCIPVAENSYSAYIEVAARDSGLARAHTFIRGAHERARARDPVHSCENYHVFVEEVERTSLVAAESSGGRDME